MGFGTFTCKYAVALHTIAVLSRLRTLFLIKRQLKANSLVRSNCRRIQSWSTSMQVIT